MSFQGTSKPSSVAAGIFQLNTAVTGFRRLLDATGTIKDTPEHRQALQEARKRIGQLVKETSAKLKSLSDANVEDPSKRIEESKLARDFQAVLLDLQKAQKLAMEREAAFNPSSSSNEDTAATKDAGEEHGLLLWEQKRQEMVTLENEIALNEAMIGEREKDIEEINYDVEQVNEIYQDLAVLLHDPRISVDDIDKHMEEASASASQAKAQLHKASKSSRSKSFWWRWALIIFVMVLVILLLVIIVH